MTEPDQPKPAAQAVMSQQEPAEPEAAEQIDAACSRATPFEEDKPAGEGTEAAEADAAMPSAAETSANAEVFSCLIKLPSECSVCVRCLAGHTGYGDRVESDAASGHNKSSRMRSYQRLRKAARRPPQAWRRLRKTRRRPWQESALILPHRSLGR